MRKRRWRRFKAFASTRPSWTSSAAKGSATRVNSPIWRKVPPIQNWRHLNSRFFFYLAFPFKHNHHHRNIVRPDTQDRIQAQNTQREMRTRTICRCAYYESNEINAPIYIVFYTNMYPENITVYKYNWEEKMKFIPGLGVNAKLSFFFSIFVFPHLTACCCCCCLYLFMLILFSSQNSPVWCVYYNCVHYKQELGERGSQESQRQSQDGTATSRRDSSGLYQGNRPPPERLKVNTHNSVLLYTIGRFFSASFSLFFFVLVFFLSFTASLFFIL